VSALQKFEHDGHAIRTTTVDHAPVFLTADVLAKLDLGRSSVALLDDDEKGVHTVDTPGGRQSMSYVTESGLYSLILRSRKPEAKAFKRWITHEVLPALRQTGTYTAAASYELPKSFADALRQLADTCEHLEAITPKAEAYDALVDGSGLLSMQAAAKALGYGPNILYRDLRRLGVLQSNNLPYQRYLHHFDVKLGSYRNRRGETVPTTTTMVRPAGVDFLRRKLATAAEVVTAATGSLSTSGGTTDGN
jgi:phage antirepressor YoqD-like protein